jgi:hypothetical protein
MHFFDFCQTIKTHPRYPELLWDVQDAVEQILVQSMANRGQLKFLREIKYALERAPINIYGGFFKHRPVAEDDLSKDRFPKEHDWEFWISWDDWQKALHVGLSPNDI